MPTAKSEEVNWRQWDEIFRIFSNFYGFIARKSEKLRSLANTLHLQIGKRASETRANRFHVLHWALGALAFKLPKKSNCVSYMLMALACAYVNSMSSEHPWNGKRNKFVRRIRWKPNDKLRSAKWEDSLHRFYVIQYVHLFGISKAPIALWWRRGDGRK